MFKCQKSINLLVTMDHLPARVTFIIAVGQMQGLVIDNCNNNKVEIYEDTPTPVICRDINSGVDVTWYRGDDEIGLCYSQRGCTGRIEYQLIRQRKSSESRLTIVSNYRAHAGLIIACEEKRTAYRASCTLVIKRHSVLTGCHVNLNNVTGLVSGSCGVQEAHSSDNNYNCTWTVNSAVVTSFYAVEPFDNCSFTQPVQRTGFYNYTILVYPPSTTGFSQTLVIVEPENVTTTCPHWVVSGRDLSCTCQTTNTASPPATVRWEGRDSEKLVKTNVQREDNGTQFTCHVTWAGRVVTSINFTLLVTGTHGGSTTFQEDASSLLSSTTEMIFIGGAAPGVAIIVFLLLIVYVIRRKRQSHGSGRNSHLICRRCDILTGQNATQVSKPSSSTAKTQQPEGQNRSKKAAQCNYDDFEDHINEVYGSVDKRV